MTEQTDTPPTPTEQDTPEAHKLRFEAATRQLFNTPKPPKQAEPEPTQKAESKETN